MSCCCLCKNSEVDNKEINNNLLQLDILKKFLKKNNPILTINSQCMDFLEKIKRMTTSLSEKRRNKGFKKSFSLVEAAIYLMLVGVLTTAVIGGAALVEKAKLQKVIEDIDYYEKAFVQFTVSYGAYPGNLTAQRCEEVDAGFPCVQQTKGKWTFGDTLHHNARTYSNTNEFLNENQQSASSCYKGAYVFQMAQLKSAKLITTTESDMQTLANLDSNFQIFYVDKTVPFKFDDKYFASNYMNIKFGGKISYSQNGRAGFNCLKFRNRSNSETAYCRIYIRGSYYYGGSFSTSKSEFYDAINVPSENAIVFYYNQKANLDSEEGRGTGAVGLFHPKMMEKIDKKLDTGIPNKGKVIPIKVYNELNEATVCYNTTTQRFRSTSNVSYIQSNKTKQGCNLGYVMKDYSGYLR